jgi:beta-1,4-mannooligosaccharide/beta-1,4-mannosyl-N-acetylglucosamine phosphorylase
VKTPQGWLIVYHATAMTASTENYYLGAALLDLNDPSKVIAAPKDFILAAEKDYECMGQVPNVVFTSGGLVMPDGTFNIYYAGADTRMCLAQTTVPKLVDFCLRANDEVEPQIRANFF